MSLEPPPIPVAQPARLRPIAEPERFVTLDVLRGFAVQGILLVNILFFAFPMDRADQVQLADLTGPDSAARLIVSFLAEYKFITLFSLLFGMGLAIQNRRAQLAGRSFARPYLRRLLVLFLFGLAHGVLLWYGDILALYAVLGLIALLCRNVRTRRLVIASVVLFLVPLALLAAVYALRPDEILRHKQGWSDLASDAANRDPQAARLFRFMADETRIYRDGPWSDIVKHRILTLLIVMLPIGALMIMWRVLALFLLGIVLMRHGMFDDSDGRRPVYRRMILWGFAIGVPLQVMAHVLRAGNVTSIWTIWSHQMAEYVGSAGMSAAYAGVLAMACLRPDWRQRLLPLAAAGRMALTNYLSQSVICGLIFYSYGLARFDTLSFADVLVVAVAIFVIQVAASMGWLRHFRFGPMEWLWRTLTYLRWQPLRTGRTPRPRQPALT